MKAIGAGGGGEIKWRPALRQRVGIFHEGGAGLIGWVRQVASGAGLALELEDGTVLRIARVLQPEDLATLAPPLLTVRDRVDEACDDIATLVEFQDEPTVNLGLQARLARRVSR